MQSLWVRQFPKNPSAIPAAPRENNLSLKLRSSGSNDGGCPTWRSLKTVNRRDFPAFKRGSSDGDARSQSAGKAEGIVPWGNKENSRKRSAATPPERGPKKSPPAEGLQRMCSPGGLWHALPGCCPGEGGLPAVSLRSTVGYFLGCLRHRIDAQRRVPRGFLDT